MTTTPRNLIPLLAASVLLLATPSTLRAQGSGFYTKVDVGGNVTMDTDLESYFGSVSSGTEVKFNPGLRYGIVGGYEFTPWFALEAEIGAMQNRIDDISGADKVDAWFSSVPLMANARLQWKNSSPFTPYVMAGAGGAISVLDIDNIELDGVGTSGSAGTAVFAWQAGAGLKYDLNDQMSLAIEYHYLWTDSPSWDSDEYHGDYSDEISFGEIQSHSLSIAFEFRF